jgi:ATP-dependent phosphofructokinase / diphosphate-dependent phosphofructokinase
VRVGILTGGGDCPGLNAVIRAIVRKGEMVHGDQMVGFVDAWQGVLEQRTTVLDVRTMRGMLPKGGTILGTRRGGPYDTADGPSRVADAFAENRLDALIVVGGNGSLSVAARLHADHGLPIIGVPKTIDNDVVGTETTFGFHTAVQIATDAIDRLHTTAESHDRVLVVEVMGRDTGWIATYAGIAGGATTVLIPERPFDLDDVCSILKKRHERGRYASIVVVAEGASSADGTISLDRSPVGPGGHARLGGIAYLIAPEIEARTGFETRVTVLGHVQRGGTPSAYDRVLATRYGIGAIDLAHDGAWGQMVSFRGGKIVSAPLADVVGVTRPVDPQMYEVASTFFG